MQIDPGGRTSQGITGFLELVALNVVYLVCCIPVVTIGAATSALLEVMMRYSDDERGRPLPDFFPAFKRNFVPATLAMLMLAVPAVALVFVAIFWFSQPTILGTIAGGVSALAAAYAATAFMYAMALVARYRNTVRRTVVNALLLPGAEPLRTFALVLVPVTVVSLLIIFPPLWFLVLTIGFSFGAYGTSFLLRGVFTRQS
ncbi:YesL family protein [Demequina litorisediminis]|uniref:Beta-carotene 15,15'-monooxygenase n=1 Tax=Demequina litorisediminis TaxID=1849022 RepID=A0ABQ6IIZ3_9MICO|nr:YesL family protein [Demequina litorisediminis]GMA37275.1 beta-carotene 15,15'-monooxygenase [Demequina litorisediminis]